MSWVDENGWTYLGDDEDDVLRYSYRWKPFGHRVLLQEMKGAGEWQDEGVYKNEREVEERISA